MSSPQSPVQQTHPIPIWTIAYKILTRLSVAFLFSLLSLFIFVKLAHEVSENETQAFDTAAVGYFHQYHSTRFHTAMVGVSWLAGANGQTTVVILSLVGFLFVRRFYPDGVSLLIASVGGVGVISGLKHLFHRPRPYVIFDVLGYSFPSGHSFFAVVVYGFLGYVLTRYLKGRRQIAVWVLCVFSILLVGFSRVFLGEHYPSDVIAGFAVGLPWLLGSIALRNTLQRKNQDSYNN